MKKIFAFFGTIAAIVGAIVGALVIFDRFNYKNRIKDGYLKCDMPDSEIDD